MDLTKALEGLFPRWAMKRRQAESQKRYYDAGYSSQYFKKHPGGNSSADSVVTTAGIHLRAISRYLDENSDLAQGVLDTLEKKVVGAGLELRPRVKTSTGRVLERFNRDLLNLWWDFCQAPEVTRELSMDEMQRLVFRSFCRDGEMLAHHVRGTNRIREATLVPYAVELLEADYLPFHTYASERARASQLVNSVEKDAWGRPVAYHIYKNHPGNSDGLVHGDFNDPNTKRVRADDLVHYKYTTRFRQTRGVPVLAPVLRRLESIKDYCESEEVAARVNAALTAFITKSTDFAQAPTNEAGERLVEMNPGMIYDNLLPGEDVRMIAADRPNTAMGDYLKTLQRMVSAGTRTSYSLVSRDFGGTYSSQRQEMQEMRIDFDLMRRQFINDFLNPVYRQFLQMAQLSGQLTVPRSVDMKTLLSPDWSAPPTPWIDPKKEADAWIAMVDAGLMSKSEVAEQRGTTMEKVYTDLSLESEVEAQLGLFQQPEMTNTDTGSPGEPADEDTERGDLKLRSW